MPTNSPKEAPQVPNAQTPRRRLNVELFISGLSRPREDVARLVRRMPWLLRVQAVFLHFMLLAVFLASGWAAGTIALLVGAMGWSWAYQLFPAGNV